MTRNEDSDFVCESPSDSDSSFSGQEDAEGTNSELVTSEGSSNRGSSASASDLETSLGDTSGSESESSRDSCGKSKKPGKSSEQPVVTGSDSEANANEEEVVPGCKARLQPQEYLLPDSGTHLRQLPKKPMVELHAGSNTWYQATIVKEAREEIKLCAQYPSAKGKMRRWVQWVFKASSRIWRGSYSGGAWRHVGRGAWTPRTAAKGKAKGDGGITPPVVSQKAAISGLPPISFVPINNGDAERKRADDAGHVKDRDSAKNKANGAPEQAHDPWNLGALTAAKGDAAITSSGSNGAAQISSKRARPKDALLTAPAAAASPKSRKIIHLKGRGAADVDAEAEITSGSLKATPQTASSNSNPCPSGRRDSRSKGERRGARGDPRGRGKGTGREGREPCSSSSNSNDESDSDVDSEARSHGPNGETTTTTNSQHFAHDSKTKGRNRVLASTSAAVSDGRATNPRQPPTSARQLSRRSPTLPGKADEAGGKPAGAGAEDLSRQYTSKKACATPGNFAKRLPRQTLVNPNAIQNHSVRSEGGETAGGSDGGSGSRSRLHRRKERRGQPLSVDDGEGEGDVEVEVEMRASRGDYLMDIDVLSRQSAPRVAEGSSDQGHTYDCGSARGSPEADVSGGRRRAGEGEGVIFESALYDPLASWFCAHYLLLLNAGALSKLPGGKHESGKLPTGFEVDLETNCIVRQIT